MLTKENVLSKISPNQIYSHYLGISDLKAKIHSPFTDDKNASFKVYQNGSFKCFSSGYQGDCLQFVAYKFSFDCKSEFHKVLSQINKDFELGIEVSHDNEFQVTFKNYTDFALSYWKDLNIDIELLNKYDVKFVDKFQFRFNDQLKEFKVFPGVLAFDYVVDSRHEIYFPSQPIKKVKKQFYKNQIKSDIFGLKQLPEHSENLIICAGKKDTLVTISFGFSAVSFQSEAIFPDPNIIRSLKEKCTNLLICYDNDEAGIKQSKKIAERFNLPIINLPEGFNDVADYLPTHKSEAFKQLIEKSLSEHVSLNNSPVWVHKFNYYKKEKNVTILLANFIIKVIALISSDTNPRRIVQIITSDHSTDPFEISIDSFISKNAFKRSVESLGNYFFYGNDEDLMNIKRLAFSDSDITNEVTDLGYDCASDSYVFANGLINNNKFCIPDKYGIVYTSNQKGLYIPASSILNDSNTKFKDSRKFKFTVSSVNAQEWYNQFEKVYGINSIISLSYLMSAINFDIISADLNSFPLLNLFGPPRSGKSSLAVSLMSVFGIPQEAIMLPNATQASISSKLAQFKNSLVWLDEFNNSLPDYMFQTLKGLYDLQGRLRKVFSNDNATYSSSVNSPSLMTGQEAPTNEALLSRCVCVQFKKIVFNKDLSDNFNDLRTMERKGLGSVFLELFKFRQLVKDKFKSEHNEFLGIINEKLKHKSKIPINSRLLQSYSILLSVLNIYITNGFVVNSSFDLQVLIDSFIDNILLQVELEQDNNELLVFWNCFEALVSNNQVKENVDFRINRKDDILSFKPSIFDLYRQYMYKTTGKWGLHKSTIQSYLKDEPYFISNKATVKFSISEYSQDFKAFNAYKVSYSMLPVKFHKVSSSGPGIPFNDDDNSNDD